MPFWDIHCLTLSADSVGHHYICYIWKTSLLTVRAINCIVWICSVDHINTSNGSCIWHFGLVETEWRKELKYHWKRHHNPPTPPQGDRTQGLAISHLLPWLCNISLPCCLYPQCPGFILSLIALSGEERDGTFAFSQMVHLLGLFNGVYFWASFRCDVIFFELILFGKGLNNT